MVACLATAFAYLPLSCALCMRLCGSCLHLTGFECVAFTCCVSVATCFAINFYALSLRFLLFHGLFVVIYLVATSLCLLTLVVFRRATGRQHRRRVNECAETMAELASALAHSRQRGHCRRPASGPALTVDRARLLLGMAPNLLNGRAL